MSPTMPPRVVVLEPVSWRMREYANGAQGVEAGGFLMGRTFSSEAVVVTGLSTPRTGKVWSLRLGAPPKGAVGWFHSRPDGSNGPLRDEVQVHAHLFPRSAGLVVVLAGRRVTFFCGEGRRLGPVPRVESVDLSLEQVQRAESIEGLMLAGKGGQEPHFAETLDDSVA